MLIKIEIKVFDFNGFFVLNYLNLIIFLLYILGNVEYKY